jgi:GDPmannose 4,6-dehydratase
VSRTALVTGVAGQDGIYLARLLVAEGARVIGTVAPGSATALSMAPYLEGVTVVPHDVRDTEGFRRLLADHAPDDVYNLAGFSSVGASWNQPELVAETNGTAVGGMLDAVADSGDVRFFQASSAEEYGEAANSPYAQGKAVAHRLTTAAREERGVFACSAILFNHESPLRGRRFVTRKITRAAAEISCGVRDKVELGNLAIARDWGHAREYVEAMRMMLRRDTPDDFKLATGVLHTLEDLLVTAFDAAGLGDPWPYVEQNPALVRPADAASLVGDTARTQELLGWTARTGFEATVREMVEVDLRRVRSGLEEDPAYLVRA